jgi:hypothetical protein
VGIVEKGSTKILAFRWIEQEEMMSLAWTTNPHWVKPGILSNPYHPQEK